MINFKQYIANKLDLPLTKDEIANLIVPTADESKGDYSLPCFRFAKEMRCAPQMIATNLASQLAQDQYIDHAECFDFFKAVSQKKINFFAHFFAISGFCTILMI